MENQFLILGGTILITSCFWFVYVQILRSKIAHMSNNNYNLNQNIEKEAILKSHKYLDELNKEIINLKTQMADVKHTSFFEGYNKAKGEFFLNITPYYEELTDGDDGLFINDFIHEVRVGYKQQLYVNNLPLLDPTVVWENVIVERKKEVDYQKIKIALDIVEKNLLPIVAQSNGILRFIPTTEKFETKI
ncbi:hypothetical protein [Sphingobacterium kyonggiense]